MKSVLKVFADHANDSDQSWPHTDTIALESGLSTARVSPAIQAAVKAGLLSKRRTQTGNRYRLNMHLLGRVQVPPRRRHDPAFPEFEDSPSRPKQGHDQPFSRNEDSESKPDDQPFSRNEDPEIATRGSGDRDTRIRRSRHETQNHQGIDREPPPTTTSGDDGDLTSGTEGERDRARRLLSELTMPSGPPFNPNSEAIEAVRAQLAAGWSPGEITEALTRGTEDYRRPAAGVMEHARSLPSRLASRSAESGFQRQEPTRPPWCGECDEEDRRVPSTDGSLGPRCPRCHPNPTKKGHGRQGIRSHEMTDQQFLGQLLGR